MRPAAVRRASRAPAVGREHERAALERRMPRVDLPAAGHHRQRRQLGLSQAPPELGPLGGQIGVRRLGRPEPGGGGLQRPRADQHRVGRRAQEPHHEAVVVVLVGDQPVRARDPGDRDHAVEGRDEVRDDAPALEAEPPRVPRAQPGRKLPVGPFRLVQEL